MFDQFLSKASELLAKGEPFAVAEVVRYLSPISGKVGDKAIILADGTLWGWIGGGCAQPAVVKEALKSLQDGRPRLVRISPSRSQEEGIVAYNMSCHSGGTLDIYVEPVLPKPHILIMGRSPVGRTLASLAKTINYTFSIAAPQADRESYPDAEQVQAGSEPGRAESWAADLHRCVHPGRVRRGGARTSAQNGCFLCDLRSQQGKGGQGSPISQRTRDQRGKTESGAGSGGLEYPRWFAGGDRPEYPGRNCPAKQKPGLARQAAAGESGSERSDLWHDRKYPDCEVSNRSLMEKRSTSVAAAANRHSINSRTSMCSRIFRQDREPTCSLFS